MIADKIQIAILGAGRWGTHLVRNFLEHPQAEVVAIVDPNPERLAALQQRHALDPGIFSTDWAAVLERPEVEAVAIATPAVTHYPLIETALKSGCHVLAEKPLTLDPQEARQLCQLAEQQQRHLLVDHTYLFHPAVARGREVVQSGDLGELRYGYAARTHLGPVRQDVDALWDLAIHDIVIFNHWLQAEPIRVEATGQVWLQQHPLPLNPQGLVDLVWVKLTYPSGFQAAIHLCWLNPDKQRRLCVAGSQGTLIFDELRAEAPLSIQYGQFDPQPLAEGQSRFVPMAERREVLTLEAGEPLRRVCDRFLHCITTQTAPSLSSGWVGAKLVNILAALTQSLNQGKPIDIQELT